MRSERPDASETRHDVKLRLHADDRFYRLLVDSVEDYAIFVLDPNGCIASWSGGAERVIGYSAEEILGRHVSILYTHAAVERGDPGHETEIAARDGRYADEGWRIRKDGSSIWVNALTTPLYGDAGELLGYGSVVRDLTVRREAEHERESLIEQLRMERRRLRSIFQQAPAFIAVLRGPAHTFELANPAYYQLIGHREIIGKPVLEALPELRDQGFVELLDRVYTSCRPYVGREARVRLQQDPDAPLAERFLNFVYQPLTEADGEVTGVLVHGVDATEQVHSRSEVERLYRQVAKTNQVKTDFLAVISHELRTPLNAIIGYGDLLSDEIYGPLNDRQSVQLERVIASAWHLAHIVDEILAFVGASERPELVRSEHVDVVEIAREATERVRDEAERKGLALVARAPAPSISAYLDAGKLRQILAQLLGNAVKFTEHGAIEVLVERTDNTVEFRVRDTGPGIAHDDHERIFEPFTQAQRALTRTTGGTGMGLAIAQRFARLLGGDLTVESEQGTGATFVLRVPSGRTT